MTLEQFLSQYGLIALSLLATVEGDASLILAGMLAHRGVLSLPAVIIAGAAGNFVGDCACTSSDGRPGLDCATPRYIAAPAPGSSESPHASAAGNSCSPPWGMAPATRAWSSGARPISRFSASPSPTCWAVSWPRQGSPCWDT